MICIALGQSTVTAHIRLFGVSPDVTLLFVVAWVLLEGTREGIFAGLVGGVTLDALSGAPFGLLTLALISVAGVSGVGEINIFRTARFLPYITIGLATLIYKSIFLSLLQVIGWRVIWGPTLLRVVLPATVVNLLCMPFIYGLAYWLHIHLHPKTVEWQ
jgi:rod shape-determining protein MreD